MQFTAVGSTLFFIANDGNNGNELWKSNGTPAGTLLVKTIASSSTTPPAWLTNVNGTLYFSANDGTTGVELWKSDGSSAGTVRLKDIRSGSYSSSPNWLTNVNGTLFFSATDGTTGNELWKSDGTAAGTVIAKDIVPGVVSGQPGELANIRGTLIFAASNGVNGREVWASDGTAAGTVQIVDVVSGPHRHRRAACSPWAERFSSRPMTAQHARELWGVSEPNVAPSGTNKTVTALEDMPYTISVADFGFTDAGNTIPDSLLSVQMTAAPATGTLQDNGIGVTVNQIIPVADITGGKLVYTPPPNKNGNALAAITFKVQDDGGTANGGSDTALTNNTLTVNVTSVNDPPVSADHTITVFDHRAADISIFVFPTGAFPYSDPNDTPPIGTGPANGVLAVKIVTLPALGSVTLNGSPVTAGQFISRSDKLLYTSGASDFTSQSPYTSFTFQVKDDGGTTNGGIDLDPTVHTLTIDLIGNNTPPVARITR